MNKDFIKIINDYGSIYIKLSENPISQLASLRRAANNKGFRIKYKIGKAVFGNNCENIAKIEKVSGEPVKKWSYYVKKNHGGEKILGETAKKVIELSKTLKYQKDIAKALNISKQRVSQILINYKLNKKNREF